VSIRESLSGMNLAPPNRLWFVIPAKAHWRQLKRISMYFKVLTNAAWATQRHPREGGGPGSPRKTWIPAFAGMTFRRLISFVSTYQHRKNP
jgi:hypothetical protein